MEFPREKWGTVMGFVGLTMGFAPNIGPTIAGAMVAAADWRSFFFAAFACCIVLGAVSYPLMKGAPKAAERSLALSPLSLALSVAGFGGLLMGVSNASSAGFASPVFFVPVAIGAACMAVFVRRELALANPMLNFRVFRSRTFTAGTVMICLLFCAFIGVTLVIPLELQEVHGASALEAGMAMLPGTVSALIMNPLSGVLTDRMGPRFVCRAGCVLLLAGTVLMIDLDSVESLWQVMAFQAVRAFGISSLIVPFTTWSVRTLDQESVPDGTSISNAFRQIAAAFGTSVMVLIMAGGATDGSVTTTGVDTAMAFSLVLVAVMTVICFARIKKDA